MIGPFPPSSPIADPGTTYQRQLHRRSSNEDICATSSQEEYQPRFNKSRPFLGKPQFAGIGSAQQHHYPTPQASSSTGRSSSPIRTNATGSPSSLLSDSEVHEPITLTGSDAVKIELDPHNCSCLAVGRKKSVCDIVLPGRKNISRQHAFISYLPSKGQVKLECNGTNGIVVVLPHEMTGTFSRKDPKIPMYELCSTITDQESVDHRKITKKSHRVTSFVLLKGESVVMPFFAGTLIDFRQAEAVLSLKESDYSFDENDNSTETEDEIEALMTKSDDFHEGSNTPERFIKVAASPSTLRISDGNNAQRSPSSPCFHRSPQSMKFAADPPLPASQATPLKTFSILAPVTPQKARRLENKLVLADQSRETPISKNRKIKADSNPLDNRKPIESPSKPNSTDEKKHKQRKTVETSKSAQGSLTALEESELQHVLANHLAFANVQQTPLSQLQEVNSRASAISRQELRSLLAKEPCIGVIYREGKDAAGKPLDEEYYYDVENDSDEERRNLVNALKGGRSGLRSCRRTHKQYFWKKPAK